MGSEFDEQCFGGWRDIGHRFRRHADEGACAMSRVERVLRGVQMGTSFASAASERKAVAIRSLEREVDHAEQFDKPAQ